MAKQYLKWLNNYYQNNNNNSNNNLNINHDNNRNIKSSSPVPNNNNSYDVSTNINSTFAESDHGISYQKEIIRNDLPGDMGRTYASTYDSTQVPGYTLTPVYDIHLNQNLNQSKYIDNNVNINNSNYESIRFNNQENYMEGYVQNNVMYGMDEHIQQQQQLQSMNNINNNGINLNLNNGINLNNLGNLNLGVGTGNRHQILLGSNSMSPMDRTLDLHSINSINNLNNISLNNSMVQNSGTTYYDKTGVAYYKQESNMQNINIQNIQNLQGMNMRNNIMNSQYDSNVQYLSTYAGSENFVYNDHENNYLNTNQSMMIDGNGNNVSVGENNGYEELEITRGYYTENDGMQQITTNNNIQNINLISNENKNNNQYYQTQNALIPYTNYIPLVLTQPTQQIIPVEIPKIKPLDLDSKAKPFNPSFTVSSNYGSSPQKEVVIVQKEVVVETVGKENKVVVVVDEVVIEVVGEVVAEVGLKENKENKCQIEGVIEGGEGVGEREGVDEQKDETRNSTDNDENVTKNIIQSDNFEKNDSTNKNEINDKIEKIEIDIENDKISNENKSSVGNNR